MRFLLAWAGLLLGLGTVWALSNVPPHGVPIPPDLRRNLEQETHRLEAELNALHQLPGGTPRLWADVAVLHKSVDWALRHDEILHTNEIADAQRTLAMAFDRAAQLRRGKADWLTQTGRVIRGFISRIDRSPQPYGVVVGPRSIPGGRLDVWLHGRDESLTELRFIRERMRSTGEFAPEDAVVVHPYGRYCNAFKFAGETDVLEALEHATEQYAADPARRSIRGFSMGGAGTWHLAAHHPGLWRAAAPGAGFAETAEYVGIRPNDTSIPPWERLLWGWYDATVSAANFHQVPTLAYSGEKDRQIQAARAMERALQSEGLFLQHLVGPGVEHRYEPATKAELIRRFDVLVQAPPHELRELHLVTRTLRHPTGEGDVWLRFEGLQHHWQESRLDARIVSPTRVEIVTRGVTRFSATRPPGTAALPITWFIDGQPVPPHRGAGTGLTVFVRHPSGWAFATARELDDNAPRKRPGLQGPIDDAFMDSFIVAVPTGTSRSPAVQTWTSAALEQFKRDWRTQFRGDPPLVPDIEVTDALLRQHHVIAWGDPDSNALLRRAFALRTPVEWTPKQIRIGAVRHPAADHAPAFILPNPLAPARYLVVNSGPTFARWEGTNARQTPRLPDWAVWKIADPAGPRIRHAGFFDENWRPGSAMTPDIEP